MPAIIFSTSVGVDASGASYVSINSVSSTRFTTYSYELEDTDLGGIDSGPINTSTLPLRLYKPGGVYWLTIIDEVTGQRSNPKTVTIPQANPTPPVGAYTIAITNVVFQKRTTSNGLDVKIYYTTTQPGGQIVVQSNINFLPTDYHENDGQPISTVGLPTPTWPGLVIEGQTYTVTLRTKVGAASQAVATFTAPIYGCTDPGADNYNPNATAEDFSCYFGPRVQPFGYSLPVIGGEAPLYARFTERLLPRVSGQLQEPAPAVAFLNLESLGSQLVTLTINGYRFQSGPAIDPSRFQDAPSLVQVLNSNPALAATYIIRQSQDEEVRLTAREIGTAYNLTITTSNAGALSFITTPGVNRHFSQGVYGWGIYCEVWVLPNQPYGDFSSNSANTTGAVLAMPRMELPAAYDWNGLSMGAGQTHVYSFDIAPALRQYTGHGLPNYYGVAADRTVSYYLVYGEIFADAPGEVRRVRTAFSTLSGGSWASYAMEAAEWLNQLFDDDTGVEATLPTSRPSPWRVRPSGNLPGLYLVPKYDLGIQMLTVTARNFAGQEAEESCVIQNDTTGTTGYVRPPDYVSQGVWATLRDNLWLPAGEGFTTGKLELTRTDNEGRLLVANLSFTSFDDKSPVLHIVNTMGGIDPVLFEGGIEYGLKRTASNYQNGQGTQLLSAEAALPFRLYTKPLAFDQWDWLRQQLAVSPRLWLEETPGAQLVEVRVTDLDAVSDAVKGEYSLSVELEKKTLKGVIN
jgi:hypothetical protein